MAKGQTRYTKELLEEAVLKSKSYQEVFRNLNINGKNNGKNRYIRDLIRYYKIPIEHFTKQASRDKNAQECEHIRRSRDCNRWPDEKVFCENAIPMGGAKIKQRLLEKGWEEECAECGMGPEWNNKHLVLHIDHINGISNDNRFENLRFLCPNCHSQTETYSNKRGKLEDVLCIDCGKVITRGFKRCKNCANKKTGMFIRDKNTKIVWPADDELLKMVEEKPFTTIAKELGVSDNAIRKRLKIRFGEYPKHRWGFKKKE